MKGCGVERMVEKEWKIAGYVRGPAVGGDRSERGVRFKGRLTGSSDQAWVCAVFA